MIDQKEVELAEAQEEEAKYQEEFNQRVRSMEERGNVSYWSVLFNANSFSDLLDQINAISEVMDYDNQVMDNLAAARQAVADARQIWRRTRLPRRLLRRIWKARRRNWKRSRPT